MYEEIFLLFGHPNENYCVRKGLILVKINSFITEMVAIRGGLGYNLSEKNNFLIGYAYILTRNPDGNGYYDKFEENRIYQQFSTRNNLNSLSFNHRFRFEERLMNNDIFFRLRYQINATIPLNNKSLQQKTVYLKAVNELFLNVIKKNEFDRNISSLNVGYVINPILTLEGGYMKQYIKHSQTNHLLLSILINNPFFLKKRGLIT